MPEVNAFNDLPYFAPLPPGASTSPDDVRQYFEGFLQNTNLYSTRRPTFKAIVGPTKLGGIDFTDIQEAIDFVNNKGGGSILIKEGRYYPRSSIVPKTNISLYGEGIGRTIIDFSKAIISNEDGGLKIVGLEIDSNASTFVLTNGSSTVTSATGTFVSSGVTQGDFLLIFGFPYEILSVQSNTSLTLKDPYRGKTVTNFGDITRVEDSRSIRLTDFTVTGSPEIGVLLSKSMSVDVFNVETTGNGSNGIKVELSGLFSILKSLSHRNTGSGMYVPFGSGIISGNNVSNNAAGGATLFGDYIQFIGNTVNYNTGGGLSISGNSLNTIVNNIIVGNTSTGVVGEVCDHNLISGNLIESNGGSGIDIYDILESATHSNRITNNTIRNNTGDGVVLTCLDTGVEVNDNMIVSNTIEGNGGDGVNLNPATGSINRTIINDNSIISNGAWGIFINGAGANDTSISGNTLSGNTSGAIRDLGTRTMIDTNQGAPTTSTARNMLRTQRDGTNLTTTSTSWVDITSLSSTFTPSFIENVNIALSVGVSKNQTINENIFFTISINGDVAGVNTGLIYNRTTEATNDWDSDHATWADQLTAGMAWTIKGRWKVSSSTADLGAGVAWSTLDIVRVSRQ